MHMDRMHLNLPFRNIDELGEISRIEKKMDTDTTVVTTKICKEKEGKAG
jgi:hypothetical protein